MAKIKTIQCPQCNGLNPQKIAEGEYKCLYCDNLFHVEEKKPVKVQDVFNSIRGHKPQHLDPASAKKVGRIVKLSVLIMVLGMAAGIILPIVLAFQPDEKVNSDGIKQESGWQAASSDSKKYFVTRKGGIMWKMMKETGERLDSARYTLVVMELKTNKRLASTRWAKTMTWRESFDFSKNYYDRVFAIGDTVWIISSEDRINGYDVYTGKLKVSADKLEDTYKEFAPGISEAVEIYNKPAMEIKTDDGFSYAFVPRLKMIMERKKFDDYVYKNKSKKTFYALNQGTRPALWKIRMNVPMFENAGSVTHWLAETRKENKSNYMITSQGLDLLDSVPTSTIFYKGQMMTWNDNSAVVVYRESLAKKSAVLITRMGDDGNAKWKTSLDQVKGLTDVFRNDQYIQYFPGEKELIIVHESANLIATGIDMETGKINWTIFEDR